MMQNICGQNNISDIYIIVQASGDSCIDHCFYTKNVCKDLCTHTCIYLTDPGTYHNYFLTFQSSFVKVHGCSGCNLYILHFFFNSDNFLFHCSDNSDTFHIKIPLLYNCNFCDTRIAQAACQRAIHEYQIIYNSNI